MSDSDEETATDHQLKFVLLGDGASGKVSLVSSSETLYSSVDRIVRLLEIACCILYVTWSNCGTCSFLDVHMCEVFPGELRQSLQANFRAGFLSGENSSTRFVSKLAGFEMIAIMISRTK